MVRPQSGDGASGDAPRAAVQALGWSILGCLLIATFLGLSKHGNPIWDDARVFFLPAGVLLMLQSLILGGRRAHPIAAIPPNRALAPGVFACGLGSAGLGLEQLDPGGPWSVLTIPMCVFLGLLCLREAIRGRRSWIVVQGPSLWPPFVYRAGLWMFGLAWPVGVLWALGLA